MTVFPGRRVAASPLLRRAAVMLAAAVAAFPISVTAQDTREADVRAAVATFGSLPPIGGVSISPDGRHLVMLVAIDGTYHVGARDLESGAARMLLAADPTEFLFNWCRFASNERVVCSIRKAIELRAGDHGLGLRYAAGGRTIATRLIAVDVDGSDVVQLVPQAVSRPGRNRVWNATDQDTVISWLPDEPDVILIQLARDDRIHPSVYRLDIRRNALQRVQAHRSNILRWYADDQGEVRVGAGFRGNTPFALHASADGWKEQDLAPLAGVEPPTLLAFVPGRDEAWVTANAGADTRGIHRIDLASGALHETLFSDARFDAGGLVFDAARRTPLAVTYRGEFPAVRWLDAGLEARVAAVAAVLPGAPDRIRPLPMDDARNRILLHSEGNGTVPATWLYDHDAKDLVLLARSHAGIEQVAVTRSVRYEARDGERIPAYITVPPGDGPHPSVLLPHGGPWSRDDGSFDYWVQFLVSRGIAVLQPNFRGSSGYGDRFLSLGFEQWGLAMQDDLMDGLDWMIEAGIADPERVCVVGGSYGGYAALVASFRAPERLRCAAAFAPVADLDMLAIEWRSFRLGELGAARIQTGAARDQASPVARIADIAVPLLLVHGDLDRSVHVAQSRRLVEALRAAGKPHRYIEQPSGDHHLSLETHRIEFLAALDDFLAEHLSLP